MCTHEHSQSNEEIHHRRAVTRKTKSSKFLLHHEENALIWRRRRPWWVPIFYARMVCFRRRTRIKRRRTICIARVGNGEDQYHARTRGKVESPSRQLQGDELRRFEGSNRGHFAFTSGAVSVIKYPMYVMKFGLLRLRVRRNPPKKPLESHERRSRKIS